MENAMSGRKAHGRHGSRLPKHLRRGRPLYPCTDIASSYKAACYEFQPIYVVSAVGNDFGKAFRLCARVRAGFRYYCHRGFGLVASTEANSRFARLPAQARYADMLCQLGTTNEARSTCSGAAVMGFISYYRERVEADALCGMVNPSVRKRCLSDARAYSAFLGLRSD
jgi:hypothetical protein